MGLVGKGRREKESFSHKMLFNYYFTLFFNFKYFKIEELTICDVVSTLPGI